MGASDDGTRVRFPPCNPEETASGRKLCCARFWFCRSGPPAPPTQGPRDGGGNPTARGLGGGAWPVRSQQNHEPVPPQVPEPVGAGGEIPLPAGDWFAVARYEEGRKGLDPSKSE